VLSKWSPCAGREVADFLPLLTTVNPSFNDFNAPFNDLNTSAEALDPFSTL
jgi:hypothetical protein